MSNHTNKTLVKLCKLDINQKKVDVFSRYTWVEPLKNKTTKESERGLMIILNQVKSRKIRTDEGSEFNHKWVIFFFIIINFFVNFQILLVLAH
jgi:hypothetical protein